MAPGIRARALETRQVLRDNQRRRERRGAGFGMGVNPRRLMTHETMLPVIGGAVFKIEIGP
jgi:hypothetical protein